MTSNGRDFEHQMIGSCDNCGSRDEEREDVRRLYLLPEPTVVDEVEAWCASCRSQYPHEPAGS